MIHWKPFDRISKLVTSNISASSMQTILHEAGLHQRKACRVVYLRKPHKDAQKSWAKDHEEWRKVDWEQVISLDECYVYMGDDQETVWVTQRVDKEFDEACVVPTFKQSSLCIWACIMKGE
jgi:hypothetical protein